MRNFKFKALTKNFKLLFTALIALCSVLLLFSAYMLFQLLSSSPAQLQALSQYITLFKIHGLFVFAVALLSCFAYLFLKRAVINPLSLMTRQVGTVKSGYVLQKLTISSENELGEIACAFNQLSSNLESVNKKLEDKTSELYDRNWEIQEANTELEASYGQLQAIIEQLNEAEQKYHSLVRNIPEVVCVVDASGMISFVNHKCQSMLGYTKSDLIGKNISELVDNRVIPLSLQDIVSELETEPSVTVELSLMREDGTTITTEASFTNYIFNGINMGLQAIVRDITQKRKMEEEILSKNKDLDILYSINNSLTSTLDLDELSDLVVTKVSDTLGLSACILRIADNTGTDLPVKAYSGSFYYSVGIEEFNASSFNNEEILNAFNNNTIIRQIPISVNWVLGKTSSTVPEKHRINEMLLVPINTKNKKIGLLQLGSPTAFKDTTIRLISSIANNIAMAMENAFLYDTSKKYFIKTIDALIAAVEAKDNYTEGHSQRVSKYAVSISKRLGLTKEQTEDVKIAGILHDIGKIGISDSILLKPDKLTRDEYEVIKQHPLISNKILYPVGFSERTLKAIAFHHERYDAKGYPYGLSGNETTIEAQIIAVADAYDAMTSSRSYRNAMNSQAAISELIANKYTQFNPSIVDALVEILDKEGNIIN